MRRSWAAVTVGLLAIVVTIVSFAIFKYTSESMGSREGYRVYALFKDALGLAEKSRVQAAGIRVGQIESKELEIDGQTVRAKLWIRIDPKVKLYKNALVSKKSASLLGEYYLEIDPGTPFTEREGFREPVPLLKSGERIEQVREPTQFGAIVDEVGTILPILKEILEDVRRMTSGPIATAAENLNKTIADSSVVLDRLLRRVDNIAANIEDVTDSESSDVKVSLRNIRDITEGVKRLVGSTEGEVGSTGTELRSSLQKIQSSVDTLERSLKNVETVTSRVAQGEGTVGHLLADDTVARNIENITEDAGQFVRGITRLQTVVGLRTEYNFLANTFKQYLQIQLLPRPDKFYLIELVDDPRGYRREVRTVRQISTGATQSETDITISQQLRVTFQFGKRVGPVDFRFGIKESTGGLGSDLFLFDDRLTLSVDVFDTRSNVYPRVTSRASVAVYKKLLYVVGGADDLLNYTRTTGGAGAFFDWFLGAQLVFNDQDLRSLLLVGGSAISGAGGGK